MLNGSALNSAALNASTSVSIIASGTLISLSQDNVAIASGTFASLAQSIGLQATGNLVELEQFVRVYVVAQGPVVTLSQQVLQAASGSVILLEQRIAELSTRISRTGWDATLSVAGRIIPTNTITGQINIQRSENNASLMDVTLLSTAGVQTIEFLQGKPVFLDVHTSAGTHRLYTGVVDIPEIDLIDRKITLKCTDKRTEQINSQLRNVIANIGFFSPLVFPDIKDVADELEQRLTTTPVSVDFDSYGNYTLTSLFPKATADFVLDDNEVYYRDPEVQLSSRGRIINKVNIKFEYRYQRLHHVVRSFEWRSPIADSISLLLRDAYSMTFRTAISSAIEAAGWPIQGTINFTPIWQSGWYSGIGWSTVRFSGTTTPALDSDGVQLKDSAGNFVFTTQKSSVTDFGPMYAMAASWQATTRFAQTITEKATLVVTAPQSIAQFGEIISDESFSSEDSFDVTVWEDYSVYNNTGNGSGSYNFDQDANRAGMNSAQVTVLNKARTTILRSHRDTKVSFSKFLWPQIDLRHTVELTTDVLQTKAKVYSISHMLDVLNGEAVTSVSLALFKSQGSASDTSFAPSSKPVDSVTYSSQVITLGNRFGEDPNTIAAQEWNGYIGNRIPNSSLFRTQFSEQFIVDTPAIADSLRNERVLAANSSYTVSIPNDILIITF